MAMKWPGLFVHITTEGADCATASLTARHDNEVVPMSCPSFPYLLVGAPSQLRPRQTAALPFCCCPVSSDR